MGMITSRMRFVRLAMAVLVLACCASAGAQTNVSLTVSKTGSGTGTIVSTPSGITCGETCTAASASFPVGTAVTLTFTTFGPLTFSSLTGWAGGGCDATVISNGANSSCTLTLTSNTSVSLAIAYRPHSVTVLRQGTGRGSISADGVPWGTFNNWYQRSGSSPFTVTLAITPDSQSTFDGWSGSGCAGTGSCTVVVNGHPFVNAHFSSKTAPQPVFPMTVTSSITDTSSSATASIQFRPQDVGSSGSVYVFAVAPASLVKAATDGVPPTFIGKSLPRDEGKDSPSDCVLAQLSSSGQLVAVTAQQLQAYSSGTLSAGGASVTILNNTTTSAVAGAVFYVGYGSSSASMFSSGVYRNAVKVPGAETCPMVSSQTALWWNPSESGWGLNLSHQGNILFGTLFNYESARAPLWLVMSNGAMQSDGVTFSGDLYRTTGPAFNANPFVPITPANLTKVGTMSVAFQDVNSATLQYTVNGVQVTKGIQRQVFGSRAAACFPTTDSRASATNYQDLWWNVSESGWGINITHQDNTLFATLFTYDASGKGLWLVMSSGTKQSDGSFSGTLYRTSGPPFDSNPFTPIGSTDITTVGTMRLAFADGLRGTLTYTYNGVSVTKQITRQVFSSPVAACS